MAASLLETDIENIKKFLIISLYLDINLDVTILLDQLKTYRARTGLPVLVSMDSNAHSTLWGSEDTNARGEILEEWILSKGYLLLNRGNVPTFSNHIEPKGLNIVLFCYLFWL